MDEPCKDSVEEADQLRAIFEYTGHPLDKIASDAALQEIVTHSPDEDNDEQD